MPGLHHVEVWIAEREQLDAWNWLLAELGFERVQEWTEGISWSAGGAYLTLTTRPNTAGAHDRRRAGMNHLAFRGGAESAVDAVMSAASVHGWTPLYAERYPHAGGPDHYAGWLENTAGFKVEIVAD